MRVSSRWIVFAFLVVHAGCQKNQPALSEFRSEEWKFKVRMPGSPVKQERDFGDWKAIVYGVLENDGGFSVGVSTKPHVRVESQDAAQQYFEEWKENFAKTSKAKVLSEKKLTISGRFVAREFELEDPGKDRKTLTRTVIGDLTVYSLMVTGRKSWAGWSVANEFFDSFEILP